MTQPVHLTYSNIMLYIYILHGQLSKALQLVEDEDDAVLRKELEAMILEQDRLLSSPTVVNETPRWAIFIYTRGRNMPKCSAFDQTEDFNNRRAFLSHKDVISLAKNIID
jgi:hypothetical protein